MRGYVPDKTVREQALRIARVYSALPVSDALKEHPSLVVRTSQMSPQQLQSSVRSSLKVALPKQYQQLKTECGADGKVQVFGLVNTYEEKLAVSHALRRLHGCTSVQNQTTLPAELAQSPPREKTPIVKTSNPSEKSFWPFGKTPATTKDEPPLLDPVKPMTVEAKKPMQSEGPILLPEPRDIPRVPAEAAKVDVPKTPALTATELQKRIQAVSSQIKSATVQFTSAKALTITLEIRNEKELKAVADKVFNMPELQNYEAELQFTIGAVASRMTAATSPSCPLPDSSGEPDCAKRLRLSECLERRSVEAQFGVFATDRYRCKYVVWGQGPTLVLIPGLASDALSFVMLMARLQSHFQCVSYDLPDGVADGAHLMTYRHDDLVDDLFALLDHLHIRDCFLHGFSFGSTIARVALYRQPRRFARALIQGGLRGDPCRRQRSSWLPGPDSCRGGWAIYP